ncbi:MAG: sigma-54 dependent transcriptional regulator [Archangium sp.]|nr:sigma-54 dependent transcriptional regulator [Archangium sp.]
MAAILLADDEVKLGGVLAEALTLAGHAVTRVTGGRAALVELAARPFDVVVTDLRMPEVDGLAVLAEARRLPAPPAVLVMTAFGSTESAVDAMKAGAADYLTKPFALDEFRMRVSRAADAQASAQREHRLLGELTPALVAHSAKMRAVLDAVQKVAPTDASVLLRGESGTGKSQLARWLHFKSRQTRGAFVEVHCAALSAGVLESELFGHARGAFTGATTAREGHLLAADGGTLFLDEIGEVPESVQVKLLRFLQQREVVPVGETRARTVNARVVSATNRDLAKAVKEGRFREDFFYRLDVFSITVPPLRERRDDVVPLAEAWLARRGLPADKLSAGARRALLAREWPGNVRELENALERAVILAGEGELTEAWFAEPSRSAARDDVGGLLGEGFNLDEFELRLLRAALERTGDNKAAAARLLGITRRRLYSRLETLSKSAPDEG